MNTTPTNSRHTRAAVALAFAAASSFGPAAAPVAAQVARWTDPSGDVLIRATDASGVVVPASLVPPDLLSLTLSGWQPTPAAPYAGRTVGPAGAAPAFRLDLVFDGLVNPPADLGFYGAYDPFQYGPSPVYGFVELDVDRDPDTGGQLPGAAELRYLANVGRFGSLPSGPLAPRAARSTLDFDALPGTPPAYERSGEDFSLVLCGCHPVQVVSLEGNDLVFSQGETWVVRSRFFQRAGGYAPLSAVIGGSDFGQYDPMVDLRFSHDLATDTTTVTLVYPLDETGAALLSGQPAQPLDPLIGFGSHASVVEALQDLVHAAGNIGAAANPLSAAMLERWLNRDPRDYLNPAQWNARAIVGTAYPGPSDGLYIWTDVGFGEVRGDINGDGSADELDNDAINQAIAAADGGPMDGDRLNNGQVRIVNFGYNFSVYDVNGDGIIGEDDLNTLRRPCMADWNDDAQVEIHDLLAYLEDWFNGDADANFDGVSNITDLLLYLEAFFRGC